jgi:group I intron endonuclease
MTSGIYTIKNTLNGRVYVGSSVDIERRWLLHRYHLRAGIHHSRILQRSWNKHGEDAFAFEVLLVVPETDLIEHEQAFIDRLKPGFNIHPNARSPLGVKRSAETKAKIAQAKNGKPNPAIADSNRRRKGEKKPHSPEHNAAISQAKRGIPNLKNRGVKSRGSRAPTGSGRGIEGQAQPQESRPQAVGCRKQSAARQESA